jgi:hypothetical protein
MTSIEWLIKELYTEMNMSGDGRVLDEILEKAKQMHKKEHGDTWDAAIFRNAQRGYNASRTFEDFDDWYQETYVSKGSDDHISDIRKMVELPQQDVDKFEKFLDDEIELGLSPKDTIKRIKWYYQTYFKSKETLYTEEQVLAFSKWLASNWIPLHVTKEYLWEYDELDISKIPQDYRGYKTEKQLFDIFQSLKQPKKD